LTSNYGYDSIYQLLSATQSGSTTENYTYDPVGNRLSSLGVASYTNNTSNELTATSNASYGYDLNGNAATKNNSTGITTYAWDFENRMTSVTLPASGGTVSFKYDPFGRRIYKSSSTAASVYAYDGDNLIEETNASGAVVARYSQGVNIDEPLAMSRSSATSFYNADGLGTITSLTNAAGALAQTYTFDSFGKQTATTGSLVNPFQYTGRESDSETGLYYYRARYYDPNPGRFISEDPVGLRAGPNMYAYVQNNSPKFTDPIGLTKTCTPQGDPLRISDWGRWKNGPPIPKGPWQFNGVFAAAGGDEGVAGFGFPGGDILVCKWSRPVKQDIVRYAYFLQQYRCVDDDPKKCGSTPGLFPDNVSIESHIEKKNKPGSDETSDQPFFSPGFPGIPIADEIINKILCNKYKGILPK
jgi:RHS repeat-associated protein